MKIINSQFHNYIFKEYSFPSLSLCARLISINSLDFHSTLNSFIRDSHSSEFRQKKAAAAQQQQNALVKNFFIDFFFIHTIRIRACREMYVCDKYLWLFGSQSQITTVCEVKITQPHTVPLMCGWTQIYAHTRMPNMHAIVLNPNKI